MVLSKIVVNICFLDTNLYRTGYYKIEDSVKYNRHIILNNSATFIYPAPVKDLIKIMIFKMDRYFL